MVRFVAVVDASWSQPFSVRLELGLGLGLRLGLGLG
jgi:hypothetical protein